MSEEIKSKMTEELLEEGLDEAEDYCREYEGSTCTYMVAFRRILECAKKFPQFKDVTNRKQFMTQESPVKTVPSELDENKKLKPLDVSVFVNVLGVSNFEDSSRSFKLDYILTAYWNTSANSCGEHIKRLCAQGLDFSKHDLRLFSANFGIVWFPDLFISNAETQDNVVDGFDMRQKNDVEYIKVRQIPVEKNTATICGMTMVVKGNAAMTCSMHFSDYPADIQSCPVLLRSFRFDSQQLKLRFQGDGVSVDPKGILLPSHSFAYDQDKVTTIVLGDQFDTLQINFYFQRLIWGKFITVYVPTSIQVWTCFLTYYIGLDSTSDRLAIAITCLLGLMSSFIEIRSGLPPSSNVRKMDIWMVAMILFVVCQSGEAVLVDFLYEKRKARKTEAQLKGDWGQETLQKLWPKKRKRHLVYNIVSNSMRRGNLDKGNLFPKTKKKGVRNYVSKAVKFVVKKPLKNMGVSSSSPEHDPCLIDTVSGLIFPLLYIVFCFYHWKSLITGRIPDSATIIET